MAALDPRARAYSSQMVMWTRGRAWASSKVPRRRSRSCWSSARRTTLDAPARTRLFRSRSRTRRRPSRRRSLAVGGGVSYVVYTRLVRGAPEREDVATHDSVVAEPREEARTGRSSTACRAGRGRGRRGRRGGKRASLVAAMLADAGDQALDCAGQALSILLLLQDSLRGFARERGRPSTDASSGK